MTVIDPAEQLQQEALGSVEQRNPNFQRLDDTARTLVEARFLDVARVGLYRTEFYAAERARLIAYVMQCYLDNQLFIPSDTELQPDEAIIQYVDDKIFEYQAAIQSGEDQSLVVELFEIQAGIRSELADAHDRVRAARIEATTSRSNNYAAHEYLSGILTPEQLEVFDKKVGIPIRAALQPVAIEAPIASTGEQFASIVDQEFKPESKHEPWRWLHMIRDLVTIKPPLSGEVAVVAPEVATEAIEIN